MAADQSISEMKDSLLFCVSEGDMNAFPCNASPIQSVSLGIAAGGMALLFTVFLMSKVNTKKFRVVYFEKVVVL